VCAICGVCRLSGLQHVVASLFKEVCCGDLWRVAGSFGAIGATVKVRRFRHFLQLEALQSPKIQNNCHHRHIPYNRSDGSTRGVRSLRARHFSVCGPVGQSRGGFPAEVPPRVTFSTTLEQSMIRTWKCLLGAWAVCAFVCQSGYSQAIVIDELGTARVQPGPATPRPADVLYSDSEPVWTADFQPPPGVGVDPVTVPDDGSVGYAVTEDAAEILYRIQRTDRHMLGLQDDGYTSAGAFIPLQMYDGGNMLIAVDPRAFVSDSGQGGMNFGITARRYSPRLQRVLVFSQWFDYDRTGQAGYAQYGIHAATLGKFWSLRGNINLPVGQSHEFYNRAFTGLAYQGNNLLLTNNAKLETAYQRYDAEFSFPLPYFARFGFEFGVGAYYLNGAFEGVQDSPGASVRFEAQVTEDLWANALMTQDDVFGSNLSLNFELTLPDAPPSRIMRRLPIKQYMVQSDKRMYRVARGIENRPESELATSTNPDFGGGPIVIAHIDPNATTPGDGTFENPFSSVQQYESLADADQDNFELILVAGRDDGTDTNLNTTVTLFNGQRLLGSGVDHFIVAGQGTFELPEFGTTTPFLTNSGDDTLDVIRLANRNEVSGFLIDASSTARGINGLNGVAGISGFNINRNTIQNSTVGVELAISGNDDGFFSENVVTDATAEGVILGIDGGNFEMPLGITDNEFTENGTDGLVIRNVGGGSAVIEGIADNSFDNNGQAGLLIDGSGTLAALPLTLDLGVVANNTFNRDVSGTIGWEFDTENTSVTAILSGNEFIADVTTNVDANRGIGGRLGGTGGLDLTLLGNNEFTGNVDAHIGLILDDDTVNSMVIDGSEFSDAVDDTTTGLFFGDGVSLLVRQRASLEGSLTDSLFENNAGTGFNINVNGNSFPAFARLLSYEIGGPAVADGNIFRNNGSDGLAIIRTGNGQVGTDSAILIQNNLFEENGGSGFHLEAGGTPLFTDRYTALNNRSINNVNNGLLIFVRADGRMNLDMDQNLFDGNGVDGIAAFEQVNSAGDQRFLDGTWTRNQVTNNGRHGITLGSAMSTLTLGDLLDDDLFNWIADNNNDGINITGPGSVTVARNLIEENGSNTAGAGDNDAGIDIHTATTFNGLFHANTIINNQGDGIEVESDGQFGMFADFTENFIAFNDGRGFDLLAQPSEATHASFTDIDFHNNIVNENGLEGVYVIYTSSHTQTQDTPSTNPDGTPLTMNADGHVNAFTDFAQLRFDMTNNQVLGNGRLSDLVATGLVVRVGTSGEGSLFGAPFNTGDFVSDGVSVDSAFQNAGVIMRVADNQFGGNFGDDVYFDSFVSTETPLDTAGTWTTTEFTIDDSRGDPLARLDLHWSNNTYDSTNVTNLGAYYDNAETTFKSRDVDQDPPGPFGTGAAQPRRRNAQRLAARLPSVLNPTTPISAPNWLYPGMGPSSFRIRGNQIQITNDGFILDDGTSLTYNNTNDANGITYAVPNAPLWYGWGYIGP